MCGSNPSPCVQLAVRAVNSARSAYACFLFSPFFFQLYRSRDEPQHHVSGTFKLPIKSVLALFRCLATIDRSVDSCIISTGIPDNRVIFQLYCKHGITKTYSLGFQECEALQAVFPAHLCPNILKAQASLLSDMVIHFPPSQEEVTLSLCPSGVNLRNYYEENGADNLKAVTTEMSLHPEEFDYVQVGEYSEITFCVKELRGLLSFAECHGLPVCVHFGRPGQPVCFSVENTVLQASVVLATLIDPESAALSQTTAGCRVPDKSSSLQEDASGAEPARPWAPVEDYVPSSQGSPLFTEPPCLEHLLPLEVLAGASPCETHLRSATVPTPPRVCSLLFSAVCGLQHEEGTVLHGSLACDSDEEGPLMATC